jgi:phosphatidylglycerophosphatase A
VVIDEVVGMQAALVWAGGVSLWGIGLVFVIFRVFDIVKPYPANSAQRLPRGWGVVADDVIAGIYTRIVLIAAAAAFPSLGSFL